MVPICTVALFLSVFATGCQIAPTKAGAGLVGAWRGKVQFTNGAFAAVKDLEFLYVFNAGGTMTESSNYDAAPPVAPAYGVWKKVGAKQYETKYAFYLTKAVAILDEISKGNGWAPNGHGVLAQRITLAEDGNSFDSTITLELFDQHGKPSEGGGEATGKGERIRF